jgi:hypothetical protein
MNIDAQQPDAADRFTAGLRPLSKRPLIGDVSRQVQGADVIVFEVFLNGSGSLGRGRKTWACY